MTKAENKSDVLVSKNGQTLEQLPENPKIGTSSVLRRAQLKLLRPDVVPVSIRGNIEERIAQVDSGKVDAAVIAGCALKRLGLENRAAEIFKYKAHPLQGNLAVVARRKRPDLIKMFRPFDIRNNFGKVWIVGAGPGKFDLMTLKAHKTLKIADVILYDSLLNSSILDQYYCEKIYVGKCKGKHSFDQETINEMLYQNAIDGKTVARLKGGDPFIFGRGGEETAYLQERLISVEAIPGISAFNAAAAGSNIPLTQRNVSSSIELHTAHSSTENEATGFTKVFYMGATKLAEISKNLLKKNIPPETPAAIIHNTGNCSEKFVFTSVSKLPQEKIDAPALIITGKTIELLNLPEKILYTGLKPDYSTFKEKIFHYPLIKISPIEIPELNLPEFDAVVFTSKSAVNYFFKTFKITDQKIFAIGKATAKEICRFGYNSDYISEESDSDSLVKLINRTKFKKILYPCSNLSQNMLHKQANVYPEKFYSTEFVDQPKIDLENFKGVVFTSPSTVNSFLKIFKEIPTHLIYYVFGKHTEKVLKKFDATVININNHEI